MAQQFNSLTVIVGREGRMTLKSGRKSIDLHRDDKGGLKVGGLTVGDMPKTIAEIKAMADFWADVHNYLDGIL